MRESEIQKQVMAAAQLCGATVFRNNIGRSRGVNYGLCVGSGDLIGWTKSGRFLSIEVKTPKGNSSQAQIDWFARVNRSGGIAIIARCAEDVLEALR